MFVKKIRHCGKKHLKTSGNQTEKIVLGWLLSEGYQVIAQPTRLFQMSGDGAYQPDFLAWRKDEVGILVVECKREGAHYTNWQKGYEKYKRCALEFSCTPWRFCMATVMKDGTIQVEYWTQEPERENL